MTAQALTPSDVADRLEAFIRTQFRVSPSDAQFSRSVPLFEGGYVDSVGVAELIGFLNATFEVEIPDEVLTADTFTTIDGIAAAVCRLRSGPVPPHPPR